MYKKLATTLSVALLITSSINAQEEKTDDDGVTFRGMPTVSSNPTSGTGIGATGIMIYKVDPNSSPSQTILTGNYTNTNSYNIFAINKMFFGSDQWQSNTLLGHLFNNSKFDISMDIGVGAPVNRESAEFDVTIYVIGQQLLYEVHQDIYVGGQLFYINQKFNAQNTPGQVFLKTRGIEDSQRGGYGLTLNYDSRSKTEKFYPTDSSFVSLTANHFPIVLGVTESYFNTTVNARKYIPGFSANDVFAMQLFGQYSSEKTPDGALAALGSRSIIRGFPIGEYKARNMVATQGEYRHTISDTSLRLTVFGGYANLSGGSQDVIIKVAGQEVIGNRNADNGNYYSGGVGMHYILAKKQQLDYRVDVAYTNEKEASVYASLNQAF